jgi:putative ABC transport system permease protein
MKLLEVLRIAWEAVNRNRVRAILTMLGIIIGVGAVIIMISISAGTEASIQKNIVGLGSNLMFITPNFTRSAA